MGKILYTAPNMEHVLRYHVPVLQQFHQMGYEVFLATGSGQVGTQPSCVDQVIIDQSLAQPSRGSVKQLATLIDNQRFDIVSAASTAATPSANITKWAVRASGYTPRLTAVTSFGFNFDDDTNAFKRISRRRRVMANRKSVDLLMVMNSEDERTARKHHMARMVRKIPGMGVDLSTYQPPTPQQKMEARRRLGCEDSEFVVVSAGDFDKNHHQKFIIKNMLYLPRKITLFLLGGGESYEDCRKLLHRFALEGNIRMPGRVDSIHDYLLAADAVLSACRYEGLPQFVVEGQAMGLPGIVSAVKGNMDVVTSGRNGFVYTIGEPNTLMAAMHSVLFDQQACEALSRNAVQDAARFDDKRAIDAIMVCYQEALDR